MDENTRLRNRIAELESLVRELRGKRISFSCALGLRRQLSERALGKPHPKWAEPNFCDGDANEKWHSRSSRRLQYQKLARDRHDDGSSPHMPHANGRIPPAIKTEQANDPNQHQLYRFTPSPPTSGVENGSGQSYTIYRSQPAHQHGQGVYSPTDDSSCYSSPSSASVMTYSEARHGATNGGDQYYQEQQYVPQSCACLTNPAAGNALIGLTNQLQNTLVLLRQLPEHGTPRQAQCVIVRRVTELNDIMQYVLFLSADGMGGSLRVTHSGCGSANMSGSSSYEGLSTPTETELSMSPISTSSQSSLVSASQIHEQWPNAAAMGQSAGYDSYFPVAATQPDHAVFHKTYHIS